MSMNVSKITLKIYKSSCTVSLTVWLYSQICIYILMICNFNISLTGVVKLLFSLLLIVEFSILFKHPFSLHYVIIVVKYKLTWLHLHQELWLVKIRREKIQKGLFLFHDSSFLKCSTSIWRCSERQHCSLLARHQPWKYHLKKTITFKAILQIQKNLQKCFRTTDETTSRSQISGVNAVILHIY